MSFDSVSTVLLPPANPAEIPDNEDWHKVETQLRRLPSDYKSFINGFGTGSINGFLWILNPISNNRHLNLLREMDPMLGALRELRDSGEPCPYPIHPEPGGLLPFGKTDNGDVLYWLTTDEPERWTIVVNAALDPTFEKFDTNMTEFLAAVLSRRIQCSIFPAKFPSGPPRFVSLPSNQ
jgi:hypothetical protein